MGSLNGVVFYLAGPIDDAKDDGVGWRQEVIQGCVSRTIFAKFLDPSNKPVKFRKEIGPEKVEIAEMKTKRQWNDITDRVHEFQKADHRAVDISDCLILYVDTSVHSCGTYFEVERAFQQGKPMMAVIKGGIENCPPWLFGKIHYSHMFDSVSDCLDHLEAFDHGALPSNWVLMRDWL